MAFSVFYKNKGKGKGFDLTFQSDKGKGKGFDLTLQSDKGKGKGFDLTFQSDKGKGKGFDLTFQSDKGKGKGFDLTFQSDKGKGKGKGFDLTFQSDKGKGKGKGFDLTFQSDKGKGKGKGFDLTFQSDKGKGKGFDLTFQSDKGKGKGFDLTFQSDKGKGKGFDLTFQSDKWYQPDIIESFNLSDESFKNLFGSFPIKLQRFIKLRLPKIKKNKNDHFCYDHCVGKRASIFEQNKDEIEDRLETKFWVKISSDPKTNIITLVDADLKNLMIALDFVEKMNSKLKNSISVDFDMDDRRFDLFKFKELEQFIKTKLDYAGVEITLNLTSVKEDISSSSNTNTINTMNHFGVFDDDSQDSTIKEKKIIKSISITGPEDNINSVLSLMKIHFQKKKSKSHRSKEINQITSDDDISQDSSLSNDESLKEIVSNLVSEYENIVIDHESESDEIPTLRELNKGEIAPSKRDICKNRMTGNVKSKVVKDIDIQLTDNQAFAVIIELPGCHNAKVEIISTGHLYEKKSLIGRVRGSMCRRSRDNKINGRNQVSRSNVVIVAFRDFQTNIVDIIQKIPDDHVKNLIISKLIPKKYYINPENVYCDDNTFDDGFTWVREDEDIDIDLI